MNSIIKMKKHPIDDLFAKKLAEHRQEPSQKAFEKFQARLQEKQQKPKVGFFLGNRNWVYYAAAAGIAIALSVGFLTQNDTSINPTVARVDVPSQDVPSQKKNTIETTPKVINNQEIASVKNNRQQIIQNIIKQNLSTAKKETLPVLIRTPENTITNLNPTSQTPNKIIDDSPEEQIVLATITPIFENQVVETAKPAEPTSQGFFKTDVGESIVVVLEPAAPETEVIPSISQDSNISLAEAKRLVEEKEKSFIAKLYSEYKHFKYGEKVDLKKLGVKDVLARVDDSIIKEDITDVRDFVQRKVSRLQRKE